MKKCLPCQFNVVHTKCEYKSESALNLRDCPEPTDSHFSFTLADPRGTLPLSRRFFFLHFHAVSGKIYQNNRLAPPPPPSRKSWIRHCFISNIIANVSRASMNSRNFRQFKLSIAFMFSTEMFSHKVAGQKKNNI